MDHNWGRTIQEMGLVGVGASLAARDLVIPQYVLTNARRVDGTQDWWLTWPPSLGSIPFVQVPFTPVAVGAFPYGAFVEPDFPL